MSIRVAIVGYGHWGPNHARNFSNMSDCEVVAIADSSHSRLDTARRVYPGLAVFESHRKMLAEVEADAVVISTPTRSHYEVAKETLESGRHVLCEKPLCETTAQGEELVSLARSRELVLMVGHVFLFNPGILKLKEIMHYGDLGRILYLSARRTNLGPIRSDVNAVYDLASHDVSIFNFLLDAAPIEVTAIGQAYLQRGIEDVAFISLRYPDDVLANIHVSWLDPKKVRQITAVGDKKMAIWDDLESIGPIMIFDKGVMREPYYENYGEFHLLAREGDVTIPRVKPEEPLKIQARCFIEAVVNRKQPASGAAAGLDVVRTLMAINASISEGGKPVAL